MHTTIHYHHAKPSNFTQPEQTVKTNRTWPRFLSLVGKHLLVPDERSSAIDVFAVDEEDGGKLREAASATLPLGYSPSCLALV